MAFDRLAALELFAIPQVPHHSQQLHRIKIKNPLGAGVIAEFLMVAGEAEEIFQAQGGGPQNIALHPDPVAVAAGHLDDRLHPFRLGDESGPDAGHPDNRGLAVGDIDRIHMTLEQPGLLPHHLRVGALGRAEFAGHRKGAGLEHPFQATAGFHRCIHVVKYSLLAGLSGYAGP